MRIQNYNAGAVPAGIISGVPEVHNFSYRDLEKTFKACGADVYADNAGTVAWMGAVRVGKFPYVAGGVRPMAVSPVTKEDTCTLCGTCASVCPTAAITINGSMATNIEQCIRCSACIKSCSPGAKVWEDNMMENMAKLLSQYFYYQKKPRIFGVDM